MSGVRRHTVMFRQMSVVLLPLTIVLAIGFGALLLAANGLLAFFRPAENGVVVLNMSWAYLFALAVGVLVLRYFPMYVIHGMSRQSFVVQAILVLLVFSLLLAVLFGVMSLAEIMLYGALGRRYSGDYSWIVLGVLELWPLLMTWALAGMGAAAAIFRWKALGAIVFPGILLVIAYVQTTLSSGPPFFGLVFELSLATPPLTAWAAALAVISLMSAAIWMTLRNVSLHHVSG